MHGMWLELQISQNKRNKIIGRVIIIKMKNRSCHYYFYSVQRYKSVLLYKAMQLKHFTLIS